MSRTMFLMATPVFKQILIHPIEPDSYINSMPVLHHIPFAHI